MPHPELDIAEICENKTKIAHNILNPRKMGPNLMNRDRKQVKKIKIEAQHLHKRYLSTYFVHKVEDL